MGAKLDGTFFCTDKDIEDSITNWGAVKYVAISGTNIEDVKIIGVHDNDVLTKTGYEDKNVTHDVIAVVHTGMGGEDEFSTILFDSEWFLVACGYPADIQVTMDGEATLTQVNNESRDIKLRSFIRDLPPIGIPNLEG
jgi:hypothetical protein